MNGWEILAIAAVIRFLVWLWHAVFHPYAPCRGCDGTGKNLGSTGKRWGRHWRCKGTGNRQVIGSAYVHRVLRTGRGLAEKRKGKSR